MSSTTQHRSRQIGYLLFWMLAVWALLSFVLNLLLTDLNSQIPKIEQLIQEKSGLFLDIKSIEGHWTGIDLVFELDEIKFGNNVKNESGPSIEKIIVELDLLETILTFSPSIETLFVQGVSFDLEHENHTGKLKLKGFSSSDSALPSKDRLIDLIDQFILGIGKIYLENIHANVSLKNNSFFEVNLKKGMLDNKWFNHQLNLQFELIDSYQESRLINSHILFNGNPLDTENFSGRYYLGLDKSDWKNWLAKIDFGEKFPITIEKGTAEFQLWGEVQRGNISSLIFATKIDDIEVSNLSRTYKDSIQHLEFALELNSQIAISKITDTTYLRNAVHKKLTLKLSDFSLKWGEKSIKDLLLLTEIQQVKKSKNPLKKEWTELELTQVGNDSSMLRVMINEVPLIFFEKIKDSVVNFAPEYSDKIKLVEELSLDGKLQNIQVVMYDPQLSFRDVFVSAQVKNLGFQEFKKIPGIKGVDAYIEYAPGVLGLELSSKKVLLQESYYLFREDLLIEEVNGNLLVEFLPSEIVVHSNYANLKGGPLDVTARFAANLPSRYYEDGEKEVPSWSLRLAINSIDVNYARMFFLGKLPPAFLEWIDSFLIEGKVEGDLMIFAFAKKLLPHTFVTLSTELELRNALLDPLPGRWPAVEKVNASIQVYNDKVTADIPSASLYGSSLKNGKVNIPTYLNEKLPRVQLSADMSGPLPDIQTLFLNSELKDDIGHVVEDWVLVGDYLGHLHMDIPLVSNASQAPSILSVDVELKDAVLAVPSVGLGVKNLNSQLNYSLESGLQSNEMSALFFEKPLFGKISSKKINNEDVIQISGKGKIGSDDLRSWQNFWLFHALEGETDFNAKISIASKQALQKVAPPISETNGITYYEFGQKKEAQTKNKGIKNKNLKWNETGNNFSGSIVRLDIESDLKGFLIDLPGDYKKTQEEIAQSLFQLDILPDKLFYRVNYANDVGVSAQTTTEGDFDRAHIHFGAGDYSLPETPGLYVTGNIHWMDFDEWQAYIEKYLLEDEVVESIQQTDQAKNTNFDDSSFDELFADPEEVIAKQDQQVQKNTKTIQEDEMDFVKLIDIFIDEFSGFSQRIEALGVKVSRENFKWKITLNSELVNGDIWVPDPENINRKNPVVAKLTSLDLDLLQANSMPSQSDNSLSSQNSSERESLDVDEIFKPEDFVDIKVDINKVNLEKTKYGNWRFEFYPDEHGMDFKVHQLNYGLMSINGEGRWEYSETKSVTHFNGRIRTSAMSNIFGAFNLKPSAQTGGLMAVKISWPGSPMDFDPEKMNGKAGLKIFDGSIVEVDIKSKKFKALGIFNLGFITDIVTLKVFRKIGKGIGDALSSGESDE